MRERLRQAQEIYQNHGFARAVLSLLASPTQTPPPEETPPAFPAFSDHELIRATLEARSRRARQMLSFEREMPRASSRYESRMRRANPFEEREFREERQRAVETPTYFSDYSISENYAKKYKNFTPGIVSERLQAQYIQEEIMEALLPDERILLDTVLDSSLFEQKVSTQIWTRAITSPNEIIDVIDFLISPQFRAWSSNVSASGRDGFEWYTRPFDSLKQLTIFISHPNRDRFMLLLDPQGLIDNLNSMLEELPTNEARLLFLLDFPDMIAVRKELKPKEFEGSEDDVPWSERINTLESVATAMKTHGVKDKELSQFVYQLWNPVGDEDSFQAILSQMTKAQLLKVSALLGKKTQQNPFTLRASISQSEFYAYCENDPLRIKALLLDIVGEKIYSYFRKGTDLKTRLAIRQALRDFKEKLGVPLYVSEAVKQDIDYEEDPAAPLAGLLPPFGNEIEFSPTIGIGMAPIILLSKHGFHKGYGGREANEEGLVANAEYAAGPFLTAQAANVVHDLWVDSELFHVHQTQERTLHQSVGLRSADLYAQWVRIMHMAAFCYVPDLARYRDSYNDGHVLSIYEKSAKKYTNTRLESKNFRYTTPEAYRMHTEIGTPLLSAVQAYEVAIFAFRKNHEELTDIRDHEIRLTKLQINELPIAPEQKSLALIWRKILIDFGEVTRQIDCPGYLARTAPLSQARKIATTVNEMFPTYFDHHNQNIPLQYTQTEHVHIGGRDYPNFVAFAQSHTMEAAIRINEILEKTERKVLHTMQRVNQVTAGPQRDSEIIQFALRFPWIVPSSIDVPYAQRHSHARKILVDHFDQMVAHAKQFEKISV